MVSMKIFVLLLAVTAVAMAASLEMKEEEEEEMPMADAAASSEEGHGHHGHQEYHGRHGKGRGYYGRYGQGGHGIRRPRPHGVEAHPNEHQEEHHEEALPTCCTCIHFNASTPDGIYTIQPDPKGRAFKVFCDFHTPGGPWTVLSRRTDGHVNFTRTWAEYVLGFGSLKGEFWVGLEAMHQLTKSGLTQLRVDAVTTANAHPTVTYSLFHIKSRDHEYALDIEGFNGTISNLLAPNNRQPFAAYDRVTATGMDKCAFALHGGWWYSSCKSNSPNGVYAHAQAAHPLEYGIQWRRPDGTSAWGKSFGMMIRPAKPIF